MPKGKRRASWSKHIKGTTAMAPLLTDEQCRDAYRKTYVKYLMAGLHITPPNEMGIFKKLELEEKQRKALQLKLKT